MSEELDPVSFNSPDRVTLTNADVASLGQAIFNPHTRALGNY